MNRMHRHCLLALSTLLGSTLVAQTPTTRQSPDAVIAQFERFADIYGGRLVAAFDSIPAARFGYRPTAAQQTIGFIAQHLEHANYGLCERLGALKHPRTAKDSVVETIKARWPKDTLVARLQASLRFCDTAIEQVKQLDSPALASTLIGFETDLAEHYSQIAAYMRMLGLVPPSALPPSKHAAIQLPPSVLSAYLGAYELAPGLELDVTQYEGALFIRSSTGGNAVQLVPESKTVFFAKDVDAQVTFTRDAKGAVSGLVLRQNGRDRTARKVR
jgi:hypothetical protein